jgi:hypothetical protein
VFFVKHIFFGPISVAKLEALSNVLVAGCAKGVETRTIELGGRGFVLKLPKPYCSSQKHRPLHVVQYGTYTLAHYLTTCANTYDSLLTDGISRCRTAVNKGRKSLTLLCCYWNPNLQKSRKIPQHRQHLHICRFCCPFPKFCFSTYSRAARRRPHIRRELANETCIAWRLFGKVTLLRRRHTALRSCFTAILKKIQVSKIITPFELLYREDANFSLARNTCNYLSLDKMEYRTPLQFSDCTKSPKCQIIWKS